MNSPETDEIELTKALEMYVKVAYELEEEFGTATVSDMAERLGVKAPSVTAALQKLDTIGMVKYRRYQNVKLTKLGKTVAKKLLNRNKTLMDFLLMIGVDKEIATTDACEIEHVVNPQTVEKLTEYLEKLSKN
ncbi:MAG: metal-dependent transcriptional regulator [Candidatus Thorarchaeota archaeon]|nr:metal-dependent transcriptional regulator [Candidatus Thorarchaeota archaeon]